MKNDAMGLSKLKKAEQISHFPIENHKASMFCFEGNAK